MYHTPSKQRLDQALVQQGQVATRSQAESYIKLGSVQVNGIVVMKPGFLVTGTDVTKLMVTEQYVSRAALKLASVAESLKLSFQDKVVLDVGSSTGGFTDYALQHGARRVIAVDVGTDQLHPTLRTNPRVELHEKTDIREFKTTEPLDMVVMDVSFISLREILPHIARLAGPKTEVVAMVKPQFEAGQSDLKHKGVIKNDKIRRDILKDFENWVQKLFIVTDKADSEVAGAKGNRERFYLLHKSSRV
jgi:23S rRNA (cytidine1920-2'-O)/16S rRNA (cytidine1409-2'-O)-methyltransferase